MAKDEKFILTCDAGERIYFWCKRTMKLMKKLVMSNLKLFASIKLLSDDRTLLRVTTENVEIYDISTSKMTGNIKNNTKG